MSTLAAVSFTDFARLLCFLFCVLAMASQRKMTNYFFSRSTSLAQAADPQTTTSSTKDKAEASSKTGEAPEEDCQEQLIDLTTCKSQEPPSTVEPIEIENDDERSSSVSGTTGCSTGFFFRRAVGKPERNFISRPLFGSGSWTIKLNPLRTHQFPYKFASRGIFARTFLLFTTCMTTCTFLERYFDREAYSVLKNQETK